jgi:hypothetical protein
MVRPQLGAMHETHMYHDNVQEIGARKWAATTGEHCILGQ